VNKLDNQNEGKMPPFFKTIIMKNTLNNLLVFVVVMMVVLILSDLENYKKGEPLDFLYLLLKVLIGTIISVFVIKIMEKKQ